MYAKKKWEQREEKRRKRRLKKKKGKKTGVQEGIAIKDDPYKKKKVRGERLGKRQEDGPPESGLDWRKM